MKLSELQEVIKPAAMACLDRGLSYEQAGRAFLLTLVGVAMERCGQVQTLAAEKLKISQPHISNILAGRMRLGSRIARPTGKRKPKHFAKRHGGSSSTEVLGRMEL